MNVLISVDMEGISGVVTSDHTSSSHKEYERFRKLMTAEANAAIEGALAGGADQIVVNDSHGGMANILIEELSPAAELISGSPKPFGMMQGIGPGVDASFSSATMLHRAQARQCWSTPGAATWSKCASTAGS